jgi:Raf kinase inhibitor-like YbhB/YbcL family protein
MMSVTRTLKLNSTSFEPGGYIPEKFTCDGEDISPDISWSGAPDGTETFTLIVEDPDAPGRVFIHWVVYNIPNNVEGFEEGTSAFEIIKTGASQGKNDMGTVGYTGPCPPPGKAHRYYFRLFALDCVLDLPSMLSRSAVLGAMKGHVLGETEIMGKYKRA